MTAQAIIQALVLLQTLTTELPKLIEQITETLSTDDKAALKAQLADLRTKNTSSYDAVIDALEKIAHS